MNRRTALRALASLPAGLAMTTPAVTLAQKPGEWQRLFNGRDLSGWETFLGKPHRRSDVPGVERAATGEYTAPVGVDRDPTSVFTVVQVDGAPAIRISGEIFGALTTRSEFENYHLRFECKWGERRWPPRAQAIRDSGCCYHATGPHGASYGFWMRSFEFQIQEGDFGDFYALAGVLVDVEAVRRDPADPKSDPVFKAGAPKISGHANRIVRDANHERPHGEWNTLDLYCFGQSSIHAVNGTPNMRLTGLRHVVDAREMPLTRGRIQLQSEGAEVFYRNIALRRIEALPAR